MVTYYRRPVKEYYRLKEGFDGKRALIIGKNPPTLGGDLDGSIKNKIDSMCDANQIDSYVIMNIFPTVAPFRDFRKKHAIPNEENEAKIMDETNKVTLIVVAWGTKGYFNSYVPSGYDNFLVQKLQTTGKSIFCVDTYENGRPFHIHSWKTDQSLVLKPYELSV